VDLLIGNKIGVYGYGLTGKACVEFLLPRMKSPYVLVDSITEDNLQELKREAEGKFRLITGQNIAGTISELDSIIISPGVPVDHPNLQLARAKGIPILGELEVAANECDGYLIAITGTNGKSTTTMMMAHVLQGLGPSHAVGNIGKPLIGSLDIISDGDFVALEVSSFQLESIVTFRPRVAVYTNLTPDHLNRHRTFDEYARVKRMLSQNQREDDYVVTNAASAALLPAKFPNQRPSFLTYSSKSAVSQGAWQEGSLIRVNLGSCDMTLGVDCIRLPGVHNIENALAVITTAALLGMPADDIAERLSQFQGYEHRLEKCGEKNGIVFFNDSKATNPEAAVTALKAVSGPLVMILGGRDKLTDLTDLVNEVKARAGAVILFGEAQDRFAAALDNAGYFSVQCVDNLEEAVEMAVSSLPDSGGKVLFSPACASFDQYSSFEERGRHFKDLVSHYTG
jgi:UDP-N-acetylmuramoylalanine--D-glutamate ligase